MADSSWQEDEISSPSTWSVEELRVALTRMVSGAGE